MVSQKNLALPFFLSIPQAPRLYLAVAPIANYSPRPFHPLSLPRLRFTSPLINKYHLKGVLLYPAEGDIQGTINGKILAAPDLDSASRDMLQN